MHKNSDRATIPPVILTLFLKDLTETFDEVGISLNLIFLDMHLILKQNLDFFDDPIQKVCLSFFASIKCKYMDPGRIF